MTKIAERQDKLGNLIKSEYGTEYGYCRSTVTAVEAAGASYEVGTVLAKVLVQAQAAAVAGDNAGNGVMGTITVADGTSPGVYTLRITSEDADAGDFILVAPDGSTVGTGTVGVAFSGGGLSFTLADGSDDFEIGDTFTITVSGDTEYRIAKEDGVGSAKYPAAIVIEDVVVGAAEPTPVVVLSRGPALVAKQALKLDATYNDSAKVNLAIQAIESLGIKVAEQV